MAKHTKQILRNNNKEKKTNFIQWEHNQIPEQERQSFRTKKNAKDLNEPGDLGSKRSQTEFKQKISKLLK